MAEYYNIESLREVAGGDEEFMAVVAQAFLEEIPPDLAALEEAVNNNNKELAYQFAHKMKPNLEMFGIDVLKDVASIEDWTKSSKKVASIQKEMEHLLEVLAHVFKELKNDYAN